MLRSCVGAGFYPARRFLRAVPIRASSLALPLGELSPKATERVFIIYPLRPSLRSDTSPKGGGKGAVQTRQRGRSIGKRAGQAPLLRYD